MNKREAEVLGVALLLAVKNSPAEEVDVILGEVRELEDKKPPDKKIGFKLKSTEPDQDYSI
jgi:hypothetical protein